MKINRLTRTEIQAVASGTISAVDVSITCPGCGVSLWKVRGRMARGRVVGWDGQCALCGRPAGLPVIQLAVPAGHPAA